MGQDQFSSTTYQFSSLFLQRHDKSAIKTRTSFLIPGFSLK